ncbi:UDP-N-acetylmuramate dehydrogenase [Salibacter sp.]|uniref:UDP-N-acetylmuramate dehydrogenase n=1 Tax=Salibacter sp. TaxID=2010995 RepID=UPI00286FCC88|nr:UDP-N-acetylmuramate dehydrogenase [Salibacter sp.]MDR9397975.1 UDP-N-acetylmuramate dehydrogenase [Salibacter sp.]MDR9486503.1 UDP-N-acetylmuramate dehydrogenase [Salibacter sp.]
MIIEKNIDLSPYNTFGIKARASRLVKVERVEDLQELAKKGELKSKDVLLMGGGSNMLLRNDVDGLVVLNEIPGIEIVDESSDEVFVQVGGGVVWHDFVMWAVGQNLGGVENLSLIPGSVGAAPMQNIGAYGVELKETFWKLEAVHRESGEICTFNKEQCEFGYRSSVFKTSLRNQYVIARVYFRLQKSPHLNTSYGAIETELEKMGEKPTIKTVSQAVINIRQSKLPNPKEIGNSGSFFKNPIVTKEFYEKLKKQHPDVVAYPVNEGVKLAAGWLIDQAEWKGKTFGHYGVHKKQALVLVNYGGATGEEIYQLSEKIIEDIDSKYGVKLEREVNIIK